MPYFDFENKKVRKGDNIIIASRDSSSGIKLRRGKVLAIELDEIIVDISGRKERFYGNQYHYNKIYREKK